MKAVALLHWELMKAVELLHWELMKAVALSSQHPSHSRVPKC
jgi:hypothetical protein